MLSPKKTKYRKAFKGRCMERTKRGATLSFGTFGLKALQAERVTARQIEAARKAINGYLKREGRLWIRIFPDLPVSKKPADVRMGSGKGGVEYWAFRVAPGRVLFELDGVCEDDAKEALARGAAKLPIKTRYVRSIAAATVV